MRAKPPAGPRPLSGGFTLVELMVVVVIVGILAAIAYPTYTEQVRKTRRSDGQKLLLEVAARQEQYFLDNKTYTTDMTALGYAADPAASSEGYYALSTVGGDGGIAVSYLVTATRSGAQTADTVCGDLTLGSDGSKGAVNNSAADPAQDCW